MSAHSSVASSRAGSLSGFPEEDLRQAGKGNVGYYPARLGQPIPDGRYIIVRKLGWGQYASVWLAKDRGESRYVALKILTCEATKVMQPGAAQRSDERGFLAKIASGSDAHRGFPHVLRFYDSFEFDGPHGRHLCFVTEALGFSLNHLRKRDERNRVRVDTVKRVARQLLLGLEYLHDVCGIVHADIKHDNVLFRPADLTTVIRTTLFDTPSMVYDFATDANPTVVPVLSQGLPLSEHPLSIEEDKLVAVLADVGHSHWKDRHFQELIQPDALRAPEVILGHAWGPPADLWNLGCLLTELLIGFWLFEPNVEREWNRAEDHLARMTEALDAKFDPQFLANCAHRANYFKEDGSFAHFTTHDEPTWPLKKLLTEFSWASDGDVPAAEAFLRRCLRLNPAERATAKELLDDPWLALPPASVPAPAA